MRWSSFIILLCKVRYRYSVRLHKFPWDGFGISLNLIVKFLSNRIRTKWCFLHVFRFVSYLRSKWYLIPYFWVPSYLRSHNTYMWIVIHCGSDIELPSLCPWSNSSHVKLVTCNCVCVMSSDRTFRMTGLISISYYGYPGLNFAPEIFPEILVLFLSHSDVRIVQ
jgi:hypothetical protein